MRETEKKIRLPGDFPINRHDKRAANCVVTAEKSLGRYVKELQFIVSFCIPRQMFVAGTG